MRTTSPGSLTARTSSTTPAGGHELDARRQQLAQPLVRAHGQVRVVEPEPQVAVGQRRDRASSSSCAPMLALEVRGTSASACST